MSAIITGSTGRPFLTVAEAADELAVTERFIRKLIADGDLPAVKVGARVVRIRRTDLEDLLRPARVHPHYDRRQRDPAASGS
jgi:excisionase family DNA binding protein